MQDKLETTIVYWGNIGIMEHNMEATIEYWGNIGIMENNMGQHKETFDTYVDSSKLEAYLATVPAGNLLLMGAVDEASNMLSSQAEALIASCGAKSIQQMGFRSALLLLLLLFLLLLFYYCHY